MLPCWSDERVLRLIELWRAGHSARSIANQLKGFAHCNDGGRSAVIGKVHRLRLPERATTVRTVSRAKRSTMPKPRSRERVNYGINTRGPSLPGTPVPPLNPSEDVARISFSNLEAHHCRFIALDLPAGPYVPQFCGLDVVPGLSWCPGHAARCLNHPNPTRPAPAAQQVREMVAT